MIREQCYGSRGKSRFARDLGIGPSTYDRYERDRVPAADLLVRAARITGCRIEWLLTGAGPTAEPPAADPPSIAAVVGRVRALLHRRPQLIGPLENFLDVLAESADRVDSPAAEIHHVEEPADGLVPIIGSTAAGIARFWEELETATIGPQADARLEQILADYEHQSVTSSGALRAADSKKPQSVSLVQHSRPGAGGFLEFLSGTRIRDQHPQAVAWRIDGDSMSPRYEDGDFVITSAAEPAVPGHPCVARQRGQIGVNCKLFQRHGDEIFLVPVNEKYPPQRFPAEQLQWAHRVLYSVRLV